MPNSAGCKTRFLVPSRGRNSKLFPKPLCSSAAAFLAGAIIDINGGTLMR